MAPYIATNVTTKEQLCLYEELPQSCGVVIFGASGDLTQRKLLPSLYFLLENKKMPKDFYVVGVARTKMTDEEFRKKVADSLAGEGDEALKKKFIDRCFYVSGDYGAPALYNDLKKRLAVLDEKFSIPNKHLYYLSTPPVVYLPIIQSLSEAGLVSRREKEGEWSRVVIEKPFGNSLASAVDLNQKIQRLLTEKQIYRIDHYLGKETVQNILMFRFGNVMFEPVWNLNHIDHVQITASEKIGVGHRAGYYEEAGILRDMFQNHLLQLLALIAMEPPLSMNSDDVRDRKVEVFRSLRVMKEGEVKEKSVLGQYAAGDLDGEKTPGYLEEQGVKKDSKIPTFAAVRFELDNYRWKGVPFYVRSGKRMADRLVEIAVQFKRVPSSIFKPLTPDQLSPNVLKFRIQPDEGIIIQFEAKNPGPKLCIGTVTMDFRYSEAFKAPPPESYVRLFQDAMVGDQTLFSRSDGVEQCWRVIEPIINYWESSKSPAIPQYAPGSWGPAESDELMSKRNRTWILS